MRRNRASVTATVRVNGSVFFPHLLEQPLGADDGAIGCHQHLEHAELLAGQRQIPPRSGCAPPRPVERQIAAEQERWPRRRATSQSVHPRN